MTLPYKSGNLSPKRSQILHSVFICGIPNKICNSSNLLYSHSRYSAQSDLRERDRQRDWCCYSPATISKMNMSLGSEMTEGPHQANTPVVGLPEILVEANNDFNESRGGL